MTVQRWMLAGGILLLSACGGGGGSASTGGSGATGGNTPTPQATISISVAPGKVNESLVQGLSASIYLTATAQVQGSISGTVYVYIVDSVGVLQKAVRVFGSGTNYWATLQTSTSLPVGDHQGKFTIEACADSGCSTVYGSTDLPYDFNVASATNLTTLSSLAGASDWQTAGGNTGFTSFVPVTLNSSAFTSRWVNTTIGAPSTPGGYPTVLSTVVTDSAKQLGVLAVGPSLYAMNEADGSVAWSENVDPHDYGYPTAPTLSGGVIYTTEKVISNSTGDGIALTAYDEATGSTKFQSTTYVQIPCSTCGSKLLTVAGGKAYVTPGYLTSDFITVFDATTGGFDSDLPSSSGAISGGAVALDSTDLYYVDSNGLEAVSQTTGTVQYSVAGVTNGLVILDGAGGAITYTSSPSGVGFGRVNLSTHTLDWEAAFGYTFPITAYNVAYAVGNGVLYVGLGGANFAGLPAALTAYSTTDGHQLWSWTAPVVDGSTTQTHLLATNNLVFVSTDAWTYALDATTHAVVWVYPLGGSLSLSPSGILYISGWGTMAAVNLH